MSFAAVDIGNTSIKVARWEPALHWQSLKISVTRAVEKGREEGVTGVAFCTTRTLTCEERALMESAGWWELSSDSRLPIEIDYATPETLGADRLAACAGAWAMYGEAVLVADAGTALTLDVVDGKGVFRGGNISPGLSMRLDALHEFTSRLPRVDGVMDVRGYFGHDTRTAIAAGCRYGMAFEACGAFLMASEEWGCRAMVVTGGDGALLRADVERINAGEYRVEFVPELVAIGLKKAYELNHEI